MDKKIAARVTSRTESQYALKKKTQTAEFFVVTSEQPKFIQPADTVILSKIPEVGLDLTTYLKELPRTKKPEQQKNFCWFSTPEYPGKSEDPTQIPTQILKELHELKEEEKL